MELIVLGSSGTWPPAGGEASGYLLTEGETRVWIDAGTGTFARLQEHCAIDDLDAIVITHGHPDHFLDVIPAFYARHYGGLGRPGLPFYSPNGFVERLSLLVSEDGNQVMRSAYEFRTAVHGEPFAVGPVRFTPHRMSHIGGVALGYRIGNGRGVIAYTGDAGPDASVTDLAREADLLLAEATYQDDSDLQPFHLSARQAGAYAREADVGRLALTHILPTLDPELSRAQAVEVFQGPVDIARTGTRWEVGA